MKWKSLLLTVPIYLLIAGCANQPGPHATHTNDARQVRGLIDTMSSPVHSYPANQPR